MKQPTKISAFEEMSEENWRTGIRGGLRGGRSSGPAGYAASRIGDCGGNAVPEVKKAAHFTTASDAGMARFATRSS